MPLRLRATRPLHEVSIRTTTRARIPHLQQQRGCMRAYSETGASPSFLYRLATAASGKSMTLQGPEHGSNFFTQRVLDREPSYFTSAQRQSGEDAFFMSHVARSDRHIALGIADGVGGWTDSGVNPAFFSHGLCRYMAEATYRPEKESDLKPRNILQKGYDQVQRDRGIEAGGSTATVAALEPNGNMEVANLGDSGFVILQPGKIAFRSEAQTHAFNTPYQMSKLTRQMQAQRAIFGSSSAISEGPSAANVTNHTLRHGDVVIFATDGLWDNLSAMDVLHLVTQVMQTSGHWLGSNGEQTNKASSVSQSLRKITDIRSQPPEADLPGQLAYAILRAAKIASLDRKRDSPFAKEVKRNFPGEDYRGGKVDDICVVALVAIQDGMEAGHIKAKL